MPPATENPAMDQPSLDAVSIWEQAYYNAWRHLQTCIVEVLNRLCWSNPSPEDRQTTIEKLSHLPIEVEDIQSTGQAMFEHVPGCQTVREKPLTYFVVDFIRDCLNLHFRLNVLAWRLINRPRSDRAVYNRLLRLLDSIKDRVPD
ncbi:uncharacterized protein N7479_007354 [Penicillium vulpinum]|uniref:uncharacterized protein n=1 Tax=Penicillium vulpinum TaxID=29845 RepID=UPI0025470FCB|nr:uncharacterized protein N7479_007354 [Penicillium vulpinum]KAJ5960204.1 hypothetical protein N7479_007354 [Penicillium vulpinum]